MNFGDGIDDALPNALIEIQPQVRLSGVAMSVQVALKENITGNFHVSRRVREGMRWRGDGRWLDFLRIDQKVGAGDQILFEEEIVSNLDRRQRV